MPPLVDLLPSLLFPAAVLVALALFMPLTGAREARRQAAWARFDAICRIRGVGALERERLARWAHVSLPTKPYDLLVRRKVFDRFVRSEVERFATASPPVFAARLAELAALRERLGLGARPGMTQGSQDLAPRERLTLRLDDGERVELVVARVDEAAIHADFAGPARPLLGPGWVTFAREAEGTYRFRTEARRSDGGVALRHGRFLVKEERRQEPRVPVAVDPFWGAVERLPDGAAPEDPEGVEVEVIDVSLGGTALLADRAVRRGSMLWLDLPLDGAEGNGDGGGPRIRGVRAEVLGCGFREGGGRRPYFLNCAFPALEPIQRRVLEAFVWARLGKSSD